MEIQKKCSNMNINLNEQMKMSLVETMHVKRIET